MNRPSYLLNDSNPFNKPSLRLHLLGGIDRIAGLSGARVVYYDGFHMHEVRPHPPICQKNYLTIVIRSIAAQDAVKISHPTPHAKQEDSRFYRELLSTTLSCGAAGLSWIAFAGSSAAIPVSGGTSTALSIITFGAAAASSTQCAVSGFRLWHETSFGNPEMNRWLDSEEWFNHTMTALDVISIAGASAAVGMTLKMALQLHKSGTSMGQVLKGLSRQQRKSLTEDIIRAHNPGISNRALKALVASGTYPKRFGKIELSNTVRLQLKDAIGASLSFIGSASGGVVRDPNRISDFAIAVLEEFEVY